MANKYCNLVGTNKIKDEYSKINAGFDGVETDINAVDSRVDNIVNNPDPNKDLELVDARQSTVKSKTFTTLDARLEEAEQDVAAHLADYEELKDYVEQPDYSAETIEHANIFSLPGTVIQGAMKGKIKGRTVQSLLKKDSFTNAANWATYNSNLAISNNVLQVTGTGTYTDLFSRVYQVTEYKPISSSSIFVKGYVRVTNSVCDSLMLFVRDGVSGAVIQYLTIKNAPAQNTWYEFKYIIPISVALANNLNFMFQQTYTDAATHIGKVMEVRDVVVINITAEGLTDKTVDELNAMFPGYIDGMQSVQPQEIKSVGKNLFDGGSAITGYYVDATTGSIVATSGYSASGYIPVLPNTSYKMSYANPYAALWGAFYDKNKVYISGINGVTSFTSPQTAKYFRMTVVNNNIESFQLEQGTTATAYESYQESKAYLKYPLRSVPNGVADEVDLQSGKLTKRCEEYVLQSGDIIQLSTSGANVDKVVIPTTNLTGITPYTVATNQSNKLLIERFAPCMSQIDDNIENIGKYGYGSFWGTHIYIYFPKGTYANLAAAQAALAGTKIVYQLAEPEVVEDALSNQLTVYPSGTVYTQPYEAELEESTIPIIEHSEPINIAGALKSESDRNTRQDEQINDIQLLLDYLIVVNV